MPAYEYECAACNHHFERRQKMSDLPISVCPECGGSVKRLISGGAGTISKGNGHSMRDSRPACGSGDICHRQGGPCCCDVAGED